MWVLPTKSISPLGQLPGWGVFGGLCTSTSDASRGGGEAAPLAEVVARAGRTEGSLATVLAPEPEARALFRLERQHEARGIGDDAWGR